MWGPSRLCCQGPAGLASVQPVDFLGWTCARIHGNLEDLQEGPIQSFIDFHLNSNPFNCSTNSPGRTIRPLRSLSFADRVHTQRRRNNEREGNYYCTNHDDKEREKKRSTHSRLIFDFCRNDPDLFRFQTTPNELNSEGEKTHRHPSSSPATVDHRGSLLQPLSIVVNSRCQCQTCATYYCEPEILIRFHIRFRNGYVICFPHRHHFAARSPICHAMWPSI